MISEKSFKNKCRIRKFLDDCSDLEYFRTCPNDYSFWYFLLLHLYIMLPCFLSLILGYYIGGLK